MYYNKHTITILVTVSIYNYSLAFFTTSKSALSFDNSWKFRRIKSAIGDSRDGNPKNVDIFAAGTKPPSLPRLEESLKPKDDIVVSKSTLELQAEYLRLEAEKDEIAIAQTRIDDEKKRLKSIDQFVLKLMETPDLEAFVTAPSNRGLIRKELFFRLAELANIATENAERRGYLGLYDAILTVLKTADPNLHAEVTSDIQKEIALETLQSKQKLGLREEDRAGAGAAGSKSAELDDTVRVYDSVLQQWMQTVTSNSSFPDGSLGNNSIDSELYPPARIMRFPPSLPLEMLPLMLRSPEVSQRDMDIIKNTVFTPDLLNNTLFDYSTFLATFRGSLVGDRSLEETIQETRRRIAAIPGLRDRVRLFVLPDYQTKNPNPLLEKYSGLKFDPVFTIVCAEATPPSATGWEIGATVVSLLGALFTMFIYSVDVYSLNPSFINEALAGDPTVLGKVFPLVGWIFALQLSHDVGHFVSAKINNLNVTVPALLPSPQIGLFGSTTRLLSYPKDRKQLFDFAIAGPLFGFIASIATTLIGLSLTQSASPLDMSTFPEIPVGFFGTSVLLYQLTDTFLHISKIGDPSVLVPIHPLVAVGVTGVLANALNFMPIGRLDGGRVAMAVAGRQAAGSISFAILTLQAFSFLDNANMMSLFWIIFVTLFQRSADIPPEDDVTPVASDSDDKKKGFGWIGRLLALGVCLVGTAGGLIQQPMQQAAQQAAVMKAEQVEGFGIPGQQRAPISPFPFSNPPSSSFYGPNGGNEMMPPPTI